MLIGQRLGGKYEIQAEIGRGGMGIVYRGFDIMLQRAVAVKVLPREFTYDPQFVQRFRQEAIMAAGLHHPGIVTIHDVGEQEGVHYIVMQLLEGVTLDAWVGSHGPMPLPQTNHIVRQVAEALDYAHGRGIVHRDIKPSNIMVDHTGQATVMDFGLVRAGEGTGLTRSGTVVGTPEYMAPEQALGQPVDGRTDIYSLGVVIYKMLSGHVPFTRSTSMAIAYAHVHEPPPLLRELRPDLPKPVEAVVLKALAKRPEERYQQAGHLADHFTVAITGKMPTGLKAVPTPPPGPAAVPGARGAAPPSPRPVSQPAGAPTGAVPASTPAAPTQLIGSHPASATAVGTTPAARRPLGIWLAGLAVVVVLVLVGAVFALRGGDRSSSGDKTPPPATVPAISLPSATRLPSIEMTSPPTAAPVGEATSTATRTASPTLTRRPATATPTATRLAPTATPIRTLKATSIATSASAIATPRPIATATSTRVPPTAVPPTQPPTAVPPTQPPTSVPPTQPPPPTNTPIPEPTNTPVPEATNTPVP